MLIIEEARCHEPKSIRTLALARKGGYLLLAMKKIGHGQGFYNGFGGKVVSGETIEEAAWREIREEAPGFMAAELEERGVLWFQYEGERTIHEVHVFEIVRFDGDPAESVEMRPKWFPLGEIPYGTMWPTDIHWLPKFLEGKRFEGCFHLTADNELLGQEVVEL